MDKVRRKLVSNDDTSGEIQYEKYVYYFKTLNYRYSIFSCFYLDIFFELLLRISKCFFVCINLGI